VCCFGDIVVMAATIQEPPTPGRVIDGGVTEGGGGLPGTVGETDGSTDPYSDSEGNGRGQGNAGGGNRAKSGMIWDEW
jgi:hypothetical protein